MKNLSLYNDSDVGYLDEEFLILETQNPVEENSDEKNTKLENQDEESIKKIS